MPVDRAAKPGAVHRADSTSVSSSARPIRVIGFAGIRTLDTPPLPSAGGTSFTILHRLILLVKRGHPMRLPP